MTSNSELRKIIKHITFMKMAHDLSKLSYDSKHRVGSLIIKNDWTEINSMGYNGSYQGSPNKRESLEVGKSNFIHAEMNALILSTLSREDASKYTIYVTMTPCETCSRLIVNKGIKNVIALNRYENSGDSLIVFNNSNIKFDYLFDLLSDLYRETSLFKELFDIHDKYMKTDVLNEKLIECFENQMKQFFEFDDRYKQNIPSIIVDENGDTINKFIKVFIETIYNIY